MSKKVLIDEENLNNIALAIQSKTGSSKKVTPSEMATAIGDLPSGGDGWVIPQVILDIGEMGET